MRRLSRLAGALAAALWLLGCAAPAGPADPTRGAPPPSGRFAAGAGTDVPAPGVELRPLPSRDDAAFASALGIIDETTPATDPWAASDRPGDRATFWVADIDTGGMREIQAECLAVGETISLWVEDGWEIDVQALETAIQTWDAVIYPTIHQVLGGAAPPDGGRVTVLHAGFSGASAYFARANLEPAHVYPQSNHRAMIAVNLHHVQPGSPAYLAVLAHELQHLAHYGRDPSEDAWFNEGVSTLAEDVAGVATGQRGGQLLANPDHPLLLWHDAPSLGARDYDASYLFLRYLADRYGLDTVAQLVQDTDHATASIDRLLASEGGMDGVFAEWLVANLLNDPALADGRYGYREPLARSVTPAPLASLPALVTDTVANYGADYWEITIADGGGLWLRFEGAATSPIGPDHAPGDERLWWSRRGDGVHTWLQLYVDLRELVTATLTYDLWHEIEPGWDYAYLRVSKDAGVTWALVETDTSSGHDPLGCAFGPAYTGHSGCAPTADAACQPQWLHERAVLDIYAGNEVLVRWDYVTDEAVTGAGLFLSQVAVEGRTDEGATIRVTATEAMDPHADAEIRMDWGADGFAYVPIELAQPWRLAIVQIGDEVVVHHVPVGSDGAAEWSIAEAEPGSRWVVIVAATSRHTAIRPGYRLAVEQLTEPGR